MGFTDVGIPPEILLALAFAVLAILSDFLIELFSVRLALCSGRFQGWLFTSFGRNILTDSFIASVFHYLSFRKRAYFMQMSTFFNVGSFSKSQIFYVVFGSFIGMGLSSLIFLYPSIYFGFGLLGVGFVFNLIRKDQYKDLGVSFISFGLFLLAIRFFDLALTNPNLQSQTLNIDLLGVFGLIAAFSIFFRTPVAFWIFLTVVQFKVGFDIRLLPVIFFVHSMCYLFPIYTQIFRRKRLYFLAVVAGFFQLLQFGVFFGILSLYSAKLESWWQVHSFAGEFQKVILSYAIYTSGTLLLVSPLIFLSYRLPVFSGENKGKKQSQKIIAPQKRGRVFSLHFSLFLLRLEFNKMATLVHTIFKLGGDAKSNSEQDNVKLAKYQGVLVRVGTELKELCFSIGKQRAYRWHVQEILSYYKTINQLELLVEDLSRVIEVLKAEKIEESFERDCLQWLRVQMDIYEIFFGFVTGVPLDEVDQIKNLQTQSYSLLDQMFSAHKSDETQVQLSQIFYRVTEANCTLSTHPQNP